MLAVGEGVPGGGAGNILNLPGNIIVPLSQAEESIMERGSGSGTTLQREILQSSKTMHHADSQCIMSTHDAS